MCGILAYTSATRIDPQWVPEFWKALDLMEHRGPDASQVDLHNNIVLGHRRLSIIDLSSNANQPMYDKSGRYVLIFNGEIYNYLEIRTELLRMGHSFRTHSDAEVILESYIQWGSHCLQRFNGMFAFLIYDTVDNTIFGARDRFGVKPIYYANLHQAVAFASEIKPLLSLGAEISLNTEYLSTFLEEAALDYGNGSMLEGISQIPAGSYFTIDDNRSVIIREWWTEDSLFIELPSRYEERVEQYRELIMDSVRIRLRADVQASLTLSGGMDSTSVYAAIQSLHNSSQNDRKHPVRVFTVKYPGNSGVDEIAAVKRITDMYNDTFNEVLIDDAGIFHDMTRMMYYQEFPGWNLSTLSYHRVYESIHRAHIKLLLEGHGNDEVLGGYHSHVNAAIGYFFRSGRFGDSMDAAKLFSRMRNRAVGQYSIPPWISMVYNAIPGFRYGKECFVNATDFSDKIWDPAIRKKKSRRSSVGRLSSFGNDLLGLVNTSTLPTVLRVFDRATMSSSIEMRAPFMDYRLIQFAFSSPDTDKIGGGFQKRILRDSMQGMIPESIRTNVVKSAFSGNLHAWFNNKSNRQIIRESVFPVVNSSMPLNGNRLMKQWDDLDSRTINWRECVTWSRLLSYIVWHSLFLEKNYSKIGKGHGR